jgi:hypothetical protein
MTRWARCTVRMFFGGVLLGSAGAGAINDSEVGDVLHRLAAACVAPPVGDTREAASSAYDAEVQRVIGRGEVTVARLSSIARSPSSTRFDARFAAILADRLVHPEHFKSVAPFLVPDDEPNPFDFAPKPRWQAGREPRMKPLWPGLVRPDIRDAYVAYYDESQQLCRRYFSLLQNAGSRDQPALLEECSSKLARLRMEAQAKNVFDPGASFPHLNPDYLLAWEEAAVRANDWRIKTCLARLLVEAGDPTSAPVFGNLLRQAALFDQGDRSNARAVGQTEDAALAGLRQASHTQAMTVLSEVLRNEDARTNDALPRTFATYVLRLWGPNADQLIRSSGLDSTVTDALMRAITIDQE